MLMFLHSLGFLLAVGYATYLMVYVLKSRFQFIRLGREMAAPMSMKDRMNEIWVNVFGHKKLLKDRKSGIMHVIMFYGFIILQFGALELIVKGFVKGWEVPIDPFHKYFSLSQEITVVLVLFAVCYACYRRFIEKLERLKRGLKAGIVLIFIGSLMLTVLLSLAFEAIWLERDMSVYAPFSSLMAMGFSGMGSKAAGGLFYLFWWLHLITLLAFAVYVPQSKHAHLIFAPINIFLKKADPPGKLSSINFEDETLQEYGVSKVEQFRQDQLLDFYSCVECGRCTSVCPAAGTGKMLSPMDVIVKMRDHLTDKGAAITSRSPWVPAVAFGQNTESASCNAAEVNLIGDVISEQELWACTTCRNCEDACPVANEHVEMIVDMRRSLVLTEGKMPAELSRTFQNIERQGNPWGMNRNQRVNWRDNLEKDIAPTVKEVDDFEYLFFVGSMGSYDRRTIKVSEAVVKLLHTAGVKIAILGNEEKNSGDTARRSGNEFMFQQLARENIETFQKYNVKKIVTACPHTFNTFKNEYPEFGLRAEVYHHTELLFNLLREGRLKPKNEVNERITYHDSCYMGRYNNVYDMPREVLRAIPGIELVEMERSRENSMCCGAGGGMMWMEEKEGKRVNVQRMEQALSVHPTMIASACPYCLTMISDGAKAKEMEGTVQSMDIAELAQSCLILSMNILKSH